MKKVSRVFLALAGLVLLYVFAILWFTDSKSALDLDRHSLRADSLVFGKDFLWGASTSAYQVEGNCTNCNWSQFENSVDSQGHPRIARGDRCGLAADHWNRYRADIQLL